MIKSLLALCLAVPSLGVAQSDLIGGREVPRAGWPEVIRIRQGNATCSASVIGPRVVLTAAHCSKANGEVVPVSEMDDVEVEAGSGRRYTARCTLAPTYRPDDHDMALCLTSGAIPPPFAVVSSVAPRLGEVITLAGFGCIRSPGDGGNDGKLRIGEAPVTRAAAGTPHRYWFETKGSAALCYGDSGGPAFKRVAAGAPMQGPKVIYGVNSRGNISDLSLLTSLALPVSKDFMRQFAASNGVRICGVNEACVAAEQE